MAGLAVALPAIWLCFWRGGVIAIAVVSPLLAIARMTRSVRRGSVETDFDRWFLPSDDTPGF
jgi:hypothetical protein